MKNRALGAVIMALIVVPLTILGKLPFKIFIIFLGVFATYEFIKARKKEKDFPLVMQIISYLFVIFTIYFSSDYYRTSYIIDYRILALGFLLYLVPVVLFNDKDKYNINDALYLLGGSLFLSIGFNTFIMVRNANISYIIYLALITIMTDSFAYFTGRLIGKNKLCESISPNKTIEGSIGGSFMGTVVPTLFYLFVINSSANVFLVLIITFLFTVIGQIGDLFFSSIKRTFGIKDFSNLIPGHGGILDRFDSVIYVSLGLSLIFSII